MNKKVLYIFYYLLFTYTSEAQLLFYQDTYKGGITSDGKSYYGYDYLQADTINFQTHVASGSIIKKAYLISWRFSFHVGYPPNKDTPIHLNYNNNIIVMDSSDISTSKFTCSGGLEENYLVAKDITAFTQQNNNKLIIPNQNALLAINNSQAYVYDGFLLVIMYENSFMPIANSVIYLNNNMQTDNMNEEIKNLNPINTLSDVGLSIWTDNDFSFPSNSTLSYSLSSSLGNFTIGTLNQYALIGGNNFWKETLPGSFYWENNILYGLGDDTPDAFIDSTDALVNIKTYIVNGTTSFSLTSIGNNQGGCENSRLAYILAYKSPCPARSNKDTTVSYASVCSGSSVQLNTANPSVGTYTWSEANNSLNNYNIPNPTATPTVTTNYIALIDSNGCRHTEHFKVNIIATPKTDSVRTTAGICGSTAGTATIVCNIGSPTSYTLNGTAYSIPTFTNLPAGTYTFALSNAFGCSYTSPKAFTMKDTNLTKAAFYLYTTPANDTCAPLSIYTINTSTNLSTYSNNYVWYVNGDSSLTQSLQYTLSDTGTYTVTLLAYETLRQCSATATKTIMVNYCPPLPPDSFGIIVPNVFSPNGDDINESWQLTVYNLGYTINEFEVTIYDRWGMKVFETTNIAEAWGGRTTSGEAATAGAYFYTLSYKASSSTGLVKQDKLKGFITLVR